MIVQQQIFEFEFVITDCGVRVRPRKLSNVGQLSHKWPKIYYLKLLHASKGVLSRRFQLHLPLLAPTNPHCDCVVGYGPWSLYRNGVIHKEGLCPSNDINRLMMMMMMVVMMMMMVMMNNRLKHTIYIKPVNP
jgi:hypothetical protein